MLLSSALRGQCRHLKVVAHHHSKSSPGIEDLVQGLEQVVQPEPVLLLD